MITWVGVGVTGSSCAFTLSTPQMSRISWNKQITKSKSFVSKLFDTILKELSNDLCSENGFRDFEELSDYSNHRCEVLVIPDVHDDAHDDDVDINSQAPFVIYSASRIVLPVRSMLSDKSATCALHLAFGIWCNMYLNKHVPSFGIWQGTAVKAWEVVRLEELN